jgi:hypothetical protein
MIGWRSVTTSVVLVCEVAAMAFIGGRSAGSSWRSGGVSAVSATLAVPATRVPSRHGVEATTVNPPAHDDDALGAVIELAESLSGHPSQHSWTTNAVNSSAPDQARSVRDATKDLLQLTKEQLGTLDVLQAKDMSSLLREPQGYILDSPAP